MFQDVHAEDENSLKVILEAISLKSRPAEELIGLAYRLGQNRGKREVLNNVFETLDPAKSATPA